MAEQLTRADLDAVFNAGAAMGAYRLHLDGCVVCQRRAVRGRWCEVGRPLWRKVEAADRLAAPVWQKGGPSPVFLPILAPPSGKAATRRVRSGDVVSTGVRRRSSRI